MKTKSPTQRTDLDYAISYLEMARRKLIEAGEPSLSLQASTLLTRTRLVVPAKAP